ncbi:MipA/OmpV family protein [Marivita sp. GX14005]|uniref:MipA/OmpV family protein n=1 Tax=Marivita sp. GX14005 TaxID=2942276 RepID=UPI00201A21D8|nr:MipA/OmpV family protein [Marivita sp. GX14005]MCL3881281.1 MipA/OmpV family protein [Marivita sp. GX14005]
MFARILFASLAAAGFGTAAIAADPSQAPEPVAIAAPAPAAPAPWLVFTLRGGVLARPEYFGSDDYKAGADLGFRLNHLSLRNGLSFGNPDPWADSQGLSFGGSLRYIQERDTSDFDELAGLDDIDATVELGVSVRYGLENFAAFGTVRRGFGGHEGWVGEIGADVIARPSDRWRLSVGPRLLFGDDEYSDTYFGVTPSESSAALAAYDPDGGLVSAGVEFGARYQINDVWGVEGAVTWDAFQNDALDSPIVEQGSDEQWGARIGLTRVFSIGG